jgi:hypothetical protein
MICGIHQLHYLPWLRYMEKIARSDIFVILDDAQFNKNGWQNRNKIKCPTGWCYLTVPVKQRNRQMLAEVEIADAETWRKKHLKSLESYYRKAPHFETYFPRFEAIYAKDWHRLGPLNLEIIYTCLEALGIRTPIRLSSSLGIQGKATERIRDICLSLEADRYLSGAFAAEQYLDAEYLKAAGITPIFQQWRCPEYPQLFPEAGFVPDLSIADLLFNHGEKSLELLLSGGMIIESIK